MQVVINFGSQLAHLIARRVRDLGVYSEILSSDVSASEIKKLKPTGIILSGGPSSVYEKGAPQIDTQIFGLGIPILGICYGLQLMGKVYGEVENHQIKEYGKTSLDVRKNGTLLKGLSSKEQVWMSHGDLITNLGSEFSVLASSKTCNYAAVENKAKGIFGVQFHPEVVHTLKGKQILKNFIFDICKSKKDYNISDLKKKLIKELQHPFGLSRRLLEIMKFLWVHLVEWIQLLHRF